MGTVFFLLTIAAMATCLRLIPTPSCIATAPEQLHFPHHNSTIATANDTSRQILLSSNGFFAWQFIPYKSGTRRLLVIVLSAFLNKTTVWIANRYDPVSPNATLEFVYPQRQIILHDHISDDRYSSSTSSIAWSSPPGISSILMNSSGSLLMQDDTNSTVWTSFDYPADVAMAGQHLRPGQKLMAMLSPEDVSTGHYVVKAEPGGPVFYASFDQQQTNIPYDILTFAQGIDGNLSMALHSACNDTEILYNADGSGITLRQRGGVLTPQCKAETDGQNIHGMAFILDSPGIRYLRLMPTGDIDTFVATENEIRTENELLKGFYGTYCKLPSFCSVNSLCDCISSCSCPSFFGPVHPSDPRQGCRLNTPLDCNKLMEHQFIPIEGADYFANEYTQPEEFVSSSAECTQLCLPRCSCTAAFYNSRTGACYLYDQVQTMKTNANLNVTVYLRVADLSASLSGSRAITTNIVIGASVAFIIGLAVLGFLMSKRLGNQPVEHPDSEEEAFLESLPGLPSRYSYKELEGITNGFSKKLGEGGSGAVYEGVLVPPANHRYHNHLIKTDTSTSMTSSSIDPLKVAVKQLSFSQQATIAASGKKQFRSEVAALGSLSHVNLVQLRGFCAERTHRLLVYEYMENGSLDRWIFQSNYSNSAASEEKSVLEQSYILPWEVRYRIAVDMARGLAFLHEGSREKLVHLDVKPQNVLLDVEFRGKLADFGLCKLIDRAAGGETHQTVTAMRGTPGYMAPEWFLNLPITEKSDIFSYGMVLLELVGGRKNLNLAMGGEDDWYFPAWAVKQAENGDIASIVDKKLLEEVNEISYGRAIESMKRLIHVAFWCIQENPSSRPAMSTILLMLEQHLQVPDPPLELTYILRGQSCLPPSNPMKQNNNIGGSLSIACQDESISLLEFR